MTGLRVLAVSLALLAAAVLTWPAGASGSMVRRPGAERTTVEVTIGDNYFRPKKLTIEAGTTVQWSNQGRSVHDVLPNRGHRFGIDELAPHETYRHRFVKPGRYPYYCSFHGAPGAGQHATIKVVEVKGEEG